MRRCRRSKEVEGEGVPADFGGFFGVGGDGAEATSHEGGLSFEAIVLDTGQIDLKL